MSASGKAAGSKAFKAGDEFVSVEEFTVEWSLQLGARNPPCNVAKFEEVWVGKNETKRKVTRPPFDDPSVFTKPAYMYRMQEVEEHSEDEGFDASTKLDAFERPVRKRRVIKTRAIQWALEDKKDFATGGGMKYVGDRTVQSSKYAIFRVKDAGTKEIEVTPIDEWWHFKRPPRQDVKMTVKEAEELMKMQENFLGPLSLANKIIGKNNAEAAGSKGFTAGKYLDREDAQELQEAGVKLASQEDAVDKNGAGNDSDSDEARFNPEDDGIDSDAGGEDDDFGDEIRSDDEEEVGLDQTNEGGGTLHQDDEDLNDSENEYESEDEATQLQKLSRKTNAEMEEEDENPAPEPGIADGNPALVVATAGSAGGDAGTSGAAGGGGNGKRGSSEMTADAGAAAGGENGGDVKRPRTKKKAGLEINQANVVDVLKRHGGRLPTKMVLSKFVAALRVNGKADKAALEKLGEHLKKVATKVDDAIDGKVWVLKQHFS